MCFHIGREAETVAVPDLNPPLRVSEITGRVRLGLRGFGYADGATLQEAADGLVAHLLQIAMAVRSGEILPTRAVGYPDPDQLAFIRQLGDHTAAGGDPRDLLFGPNSSTS